VGERFVSLEPSFVPRPPVGATLAEACLGLLDQALSQQYPAHPTLLDQRGAAASGSETKPVRTADLKKIHEAVLEAVQASDGRILIQEKPVRTLLRQIAGPLKLGEMHETPFLLGRHWEGHFQQKLAADGGPLTVGKLRRWFDEPVPMGLPRELQALVILVFAAQTNRAFQQNAGPYPASLDRDLPDDVVLVQEDLPTKTEWEEGLRRAGALFGLTGAKLLNASNVAELATAVHTKARSWREPADRFARELNTCYIRCGVEPTAQRLATARTGVAACDAVLATSKPAEVIRALATVPVPMPLATVMHALAKADLSHRALTETPWAVVEAAWGLQDHRAGAAAALKARTVEVLQKDEIALALGAELRKVQDDAARLLAERPPTRSPGVNPPGEPPPAIPPPQLVQPAPGWRVVDSGSVQAGEEDARRALDELKAKLGPGRRVSLTWRIEEKE
jgi:hypothetical protein